MFGLTGSALALVILVTLSAGGVAYALMFGRIQSERKVEHRRERAKGTRAADRGRSQHVATDPNRRRKSLQDTLREVEERQKNREQAKVGMNERLDQAGLPIGQRAYYLINLVLCIFIFISFWASELPLYSAAAAMLAGGIGLPRWIVNRLRKRRLAKFLNEFANAIDVIVRGVKAGLPLNDCFHIVANESAEPVKREFVRLVEAQKMGLSTAQAIEKMPQNIPLPEVNFFAIVVTIQQSAGGNLSEALGNLSNVLRERKRMQGKIKAMSMEAKASAVIIAALPFVVMVMVYLTSPDYISLLFTDQLGNVMLGFSAIWMTLGIVVMRKMINFDF